MTLALKEVLQLNKTKNTAVLWTGGKDCALAFLKAKQAGHNITYLVTFAPENASFKAHNLELIQKQANAIGLPHVKLEVKAPMKESYEAAITTLKNSYNVDILVTGDIDEIDGHPNNWIEERSKNTGVSVFNPLWKKDRSSLIKELIENNFEVIFSLVKKPFFDEKWVGRRIDLNSIEELKKLNIDICGENGEYHTMTLNAPFFKNQIQLNISDIKEEEYYFYLT